ncbi:MAG: D-cysteine desulfhydrase family protein [Planctomycetota bacterium]
MDIVFPPRTDLACLPTPLLHLERLGGELGLDLWIKRDDLTGAALSGNKVRKLEFLAADALAEGADTLVTCGAVNSNHARATAIVAARLGLRSHLLLRGEDVHPPVGNLLLDRLVGAETTFFEPARWIERDALMDEIIARLASQGRKGYVIPEGGSNALGCLGYARMVEELLVQTHDAGVRIRRIVHAAGSGGTTAGLALGLAAADHPDTEVVAVAVSDDRAFFERRVGAILDAAVEAGYIEAAVRAGARFEIVEGYQGPGYGVTTPEGMATLAHVARTEGVVLDPIYTGKAMGGLIQEVEQGRLDREGATVFVHTGGIFGLFAFDEEIEALDG